MKTHMDIPLDSFFFLLRAFEAAVSQGAPKHRVYKGRLNAEISSED